MNINILGTKVHVVLVFFGALGVLMLFGCIGVISWGGWKMNQHDEAVADLKNQTKNLKTENENSQKETQKLNSQIENLNEKSKIENQNLNSQIENLNKKSQNKTEKLLQIIKLILKFPLSPIDEKCDSKECLLCQLGWIFFSESCYFLSGADLTWDESRQFCQNKSADLVVIDNLQEQEFIYNNFGPYAHWLGLRNVGSNWVWIDGRINTLGYWVLNYDYNYYANYYGYWYALMYRTGNPTASWRTTTSSNTRLPLCEQEVFKVSLN